MNPSALTVELSRMQFGLTAMYHFLFVPLTLGLSWMLVVMEAAYLKTGKQVYKDMTRFWGKLFAINFAMGVVTGITLEFEFGQNWAYFSHFIGGTFGTALAIEGITAFMTEATMFGLFFFTWDKVSKKVHFLITVVLAIGTNLSIVNILVANSWMQHPVGSHFDYHTMTMQLDSFVAVYTQLLAQVRVGHVAFAGFMTASMFVLGISSYYLLKGRDVAFALRSFAVAAGFGICSVLFVAFLGDANGLAVAKTEPAKLAAIEGQWVTQKAPAAWFPVAFPSQSEEKNYGMIIKIPYALSLITSHSLTGTVKGLKDIIAENTAKIYKGKIAYADFVKLRKGIATPENEAEFSKYSKYLGYGLLLKKQTENPALATDLQVAQAARDSIPQVSTVFWAFRIMLGCWGVMFLLFALSFLLVVRKQVKRFRWLLAFNLLAIPVPYIAAESGWVVTELGRQPWVVHGILPTYVSSSSLDWQSVAFSLGAFVVFYTLLFGVEIFLMFKYSRLGPSSLHEGRYHFEKSQQN
ncbi:MAG: cytochrome d terminal oxidase subunit 1 [Thiotrichales bacterium]|nr:MAG: cytochrome d terminal oxidase subunit 1 [Thiotrichales bacterium]